jgi:cytochrome c-type biogenesis protein CcmH/NrfF
MGSLPVRVVLAAVVAIVAVSALGWSSSGAAVPASASALEAALLAPCCWTGTLSTHDSPVAAELRQEIEARAGKGESTVAIEADLVGRYGSRIRAMPSVGAFTNALVIAVDLLIVVMATLAITISRWRRPSSTSTLVAAAPLPRDAYDDRIEAELADLDEA